MVLEKEMAYYIEHQAELLKQYEGKYILIKGEKIIGGYESEEEAYRAGLEKFQNEPFFIKYVAKEEESAEFPALFLGLINAY